MGQIKTEIMWTVGTIKFDTKWACDDRTTIMATLNDIPVGTCIVDYPKDSKGQAFLWNLQIDAAFRGQQFGHMLLMEAIRCCNARKCTEVRLVWRKVDSPDWVLEWYEHNGFEACGFGDGVVEMVKKL